MTKQSKTAVVWSILAATVITVLLSSNHIGSYYHHHSSFRSSSGGLHLSDVKVKTDITCSRFHIVPDPLLLFRLAVIYCAACASGLEFNLLSCGPDSCFHIHRCLNTWNGDFYVWAIVSFWLNWENKFWFSPMLGKIHTVKYTHRHAGVHVTDKRRSLFLCHKALFLCKKRFDPVL